MSDHEGYDAMKSVLLKIHAAGATPIRTYDDLIKFECGEDLAKVAHPPQSSNAEDHEPVGDAGQRIGGIADYAGAGQGPGGKRKKRSARRADEDEDESRARMRADEDADDEEPDDDEDDSPPNRHKNRSDSSGRFVQRAKKLDKMLATMFRAGGQPLDLAKLAGGVERLGDDPPRLRKRDQQLAALERARNLTDLARRGYRPSVESLAEVTAALAKALS